MQDRFPYAKFEAARIRGSLTVSDLWVRYLAAGGHGDVFDIDAHLQGVIALDVNEHNTLAYALNERLDELVAADYVPYLSVCTEATPSLQEVVAELLGDRPYRPAPGDKETGNSEPPPSRST